MTVYQLELCVYFWIAAGNTVMADQSLDIADEVLYATENYYYIIIRAFIKRASSAVIMNQMRWQSLGGSMVRVLMG